MGKKKRNRANRPRPSGGNARRPGGENPPRPETRSGQLTSATAAHAQPGGSDQSGSAAAQLQVMVGLIATGTLDAHLGTLQAAISKRHQDRRREAANQAAAQLQVGDRVAITEGIRPLYLPSSSGTVTGVRGRSVEGMGGPLLARFVLGQQTSCRVVRDRSLLSIKVTVPIADGVATVGYSPLLEQRSSHEGASRVTSVQVRHIEHEPVANVVA